MTTNSRITPAIHVLIASGHSVPARIFVEDFLPCARLFPPEVYTKCLRAGLESRSQQHFH